MRFTFLVPFLFTIHCFAGGSHDLLADPTQWEQIGGSKDSFVFKEGVLLSQWSGHEPAAILTREDYENFDLGFDFKMGHWCESGLFLHAPRNGAFRAGQEIEIADNAGGAPSPFVAGAVFERVAPKQVAVKPFDEWNICRVHMDWPHLVVHINEILVQDLDLSKEESLRYTLRRGAIGFQHLGFPLEIRNLKIQPLPDTENGIIMFNGKNLVDWAIIKGDSVWEVKDGAIVGSVANGYLGYMAKICQDFDLRAMIKTSPASNGGIFFRWLPGRMMDRGNEVQILDVPGSDMVTGSIYGLDRGNDLAITPGEWELLQISVRGNHAITFVNGLKCAETSNLTAIRPGYIVLQMHKIQSWLAFKNLVLVPHD